MTNFYRYGGTDKGSILNGGIQNLKQLFPLLLRLGVVGHTDVLPNSPRHVDQGVSSMTPFQGLVTSKNSAQKIMWIDLLLTPFTKVTCNLGFWGLTRRDAPFCSLVQQEWDTEDLL